MEAVENTREKQEFVNAINQTSESHTMQEMKQLIEKQNETVNAIASGFRLYNRQLASSSDSNNFTAHLAKLTEAVETLLRREGKPPTSQSQHHTQKAVSFYPQQHTPQSTSYTQRPQYRQNQPFGNRAAGQHYTPRAPPPQYFHPNTSNTPHTNSATTVVSMGTLKRNAEKCNEIH
jgi:exonuclease VII large subunit